MNKLHITPGDFVMLNAFNHYSGYEKASWNEKVFPSVMMSPTDIGFCYAVIGMHNNPSYLKPPFGNAFALVMLSSKRSAWFPVAYLNSI